jgi:excisionase family DNA binding protein
VKSIREFGDWNERPSSRAVATLPGADRSCGEARGSHSPGADFGYAPLSAWAAGIPSGLLLSPTEAAAHLSIGRSKVYELMRLGQLRSVKIGASRRIPQAALADFIATLVWSPSDESPRPRRGFGVSRWRPLARRGLPCLRPRRSTDSQEGEWRHESRSAAQAERLAVRTQRRPASSR